MLLDDVMSELDRPAPPALVELLRGVEGPVGDHRRPTSSRCPGAGEPGVARLAVADGEVCVEAAGAMTRHRRAPRPADVRARAARATSSRPRRCSPTFSGPGARSWARSIASQAQPVVGARRRAHGLLLGVGLGTGARPDGAGHSRAPERASRGPADPSAVRCDARSGPVLTGPDGRSGVARSKSFHGRAKFVTRRHAFCHILQANRPAAEVVSRVRCAILLYTRFFDAPARRSVARTPGRLNVIGGSLTNDDGATERPQ